MTASALRPEHETNKVVIDPAILYFGTPVVLLSSLNPDGTTNLMPMSSVFWLGNRAVLGIGAGSQTAANLRRHGEVVLNLASVDLADHVDRLALTTGRRDVPVRKAERGYVHVADKFGTAGLTPIRSDTVAPMRVAESQVNLEAVVRRIHPMYADEPDRAGSLLLVEAEVTTVRVCRAIRLLSHRDRIDPDAWEPLMMSFQHFYGLSGRIRPSRLASIDEELYR
ncbi:MAG: flavin reductase family protein [Nocardioides sp.]